ncbi:hypothetical protein V5O48_005527 [Marasmius crinis-equi]|uniref:DUF7330 domain-containing protein n=1 Tax=Marasmius crinis-equi TaxID=585013 RepID=A0ABR3FM39_9AGAR
MIVTTDNTPGNASTVKQQEVDQEAKAVESPPPPYAPIENVPAQEDAIPGNVKPTNFVSVHQKDGAVRGIYAIDPRIRIPDQFLAPLETEETEIPVLRRNFQVLSRNGSIDLQVYVMPNSKPFDDRKRVTMDVSSKNGSVTTKVRRTGSSNPPFALRCHSHNGAVYIGIPRSFRGSLTLSTRDGAVRLSEEVRGQVTVINDIDGVKRFYIGSLNERDDGEENEDEVVVDGRNGSIRVAYSDEVVESVFKGIVGMLSRFSDFLGGTSSSK